MIGYIECKKELSERVSNTRYFNRKFYETFHQAVVMAIWKAKNGIEDFYEKDGIILRHSYDKVYESDFYNKNSCAYCEFLSIVA